MAENILMKTLSPLALQGLEKRRICPETAAKFGVHSGSWTKTEPREVVPDPNGNVLVFPYVDHGAEVAAKYRSPGKAYSQREGGKRTFWNADVMDDPALHDGQQALVICEGEFDALAAISSGCPFAVSVPDGAPSIPKGRGAEDLDPIDPAHDPAGKFEFLWNNRDRLKRTKRFIIAADADGPGRRLAAELVRRLTAAKCSFIEYPADAVVTDGEGVKRPCKDLNDVLIHFGPERVVQIINAAKPYPVRGLYRLADYPEAQELETFAVGFDGWGAHLRVFPGEFMVVTGIPSHGKSTWVLNLVSNLVMIHRWRAAICSPEMRTVPMLRDRLRRYHIGHKPVLGEPEKLAKADRWIEDNFLFIDTDPTATGTADEPFDLQWIIDRATDAVVRDGIRVFVLDPWNEVEHARGRDETISDYVARGIRMLKRFAAQYGVAVIVVAHPTKEVGKGGSMRTVTLYDIEGSAAWFNKADHGLVVERSDHHSNQCTVYIQKVRFEETGRKDAMPMEFNPVTGRFASLHVQWKAA
jgi:twinkle protein